jgi:hypothetical protein
LEAVLVDAHPDVVDAPATFVDVAVPVQSLLAYDAEENVVTPLAVTAVYIT